MRALLILITIFFPVVLPVHAGERVGPRSELGYPSPPTEEMWVEFGTIPQAVLYFDPEGLRLSGADLLAWVKTALKTPMQSSTGIWDSAQVLHRIKCGDPVLYKEVQRRYYFQGNVVHEGTEGEWKEASPGTNIEGIVNHLCSYAFLIKKL